MSLGEPSPLDKRVAALFASYFLVRSNTVKKIGGRNIYIGPIKHFLM